MFWRPDAFQQIKGKICQSTFQNRNQNKRPKSCQTNVRTDVRIP